MEENNEGRAIDYTNAWGGINLADGRIVAPDGKGGLEVRTPTRRNLDDLGETTKAQIEEARKELSERGTSENPTGTETWTPRVKATYADVETRLINISRHPWVKAAYAHRESPDVISNIYTALVTLQQAAHGDVAWGTTPPAEKDAPTPAENDEKDKTVGFGVFENAVTGKLFVGCWTEQDSRENAIEGSNFYPTEAAASVGMIEALNGVVVKLQDEAASLRAAINDAVEAWIGEGHEFDQEAVADALMPWVSDHLKADLAVFATGGGK